MKRRVASHGQHFLRSPRVAAILLGHSTIRRRDTVYDLGAGSGVITSALARRCQQVVAVENEPRALDALRRHTISMPHVRIIAADIRRLALPTEPYKVFANIPFALSADIVRMLTTASTPPQAIYRSAPICVQACAERPPLYGGTGHSAGTVVAGADPLPLAPDRLHTATRRRYSIA